MHPAPAPLNRRSDRRAYVIVGIAAAAYVALFGTIATWKFFNFRYNALDLAIFTQTVGNTARGDWFSLTIHPPSYLGDHFSPALLALALPYRLLPHPLTLLWLLQLALAAGAWPVYQLARRRIPTAGALAVALAYLINPFTQNLGLFEFHFLVFAVPVLLAAAVAYERQRFIPFALLATLALLVREDVALVVGSFGLLALCQRRRPAWVAFPFLAGLLWLTLSIPLIAAFTPTGNYKFAIYYGWLGGSLPEVLSTLVLRPDLVARHLLRLGNLELVLGLLLPFAFLPLLGLLPLLLTLPPMLQMTLGAPGGSDLVLKTQYTALFLPGLWLAFCDGLARLWSGSLRLPPWAKPLLADRRLAVAIMAVAVLYSSLMLGPLPGTVRLMARHGWISPESQRRVALLAHIPREAPVAASYATLAMVAGRPQVASLGLAFIGRLQLSRLPYELPAATSHVLLDLDDLLTYQLQYQRHFLFHDAYAGAARRLQQRLQQNGFAPVALSDTTVLLARGAPAAFTLGAAEPPLPPDLRGVAQQVAPGLQFLGAQRGAPAPGPWPAHEQLPLDFYWRSAGTLREPHYLQLKVNGAPVGALRPLSIGLLELPEWPAGVVVQTRHWYPAAEIAADASLEVDVVTVQDGGLYLTSDRSTEVRVTRRTVVGAIPLGTPPELTGNR